MTNRSETTTTKRSTGGLRAMPPAALRVGGSGASRARRIGFVLLAIMVVLGVLAGSAPAALVHPYEGQLTEIGGFTSYPFADPAGVAVDEAGDIWITDVGNGTVDKFTPGGVFETQSTGAESFEGSPYIESAAWSDAAKLLFVADSNHDDLWGLQASAAYSKTDLKAGLGGGCCFIRVAADNSGGATDGDLYVFTSGRVIRLNGAGEPVPFTAGSSAGSDELRGTDTPAGSLGGPSFRGEGGVAVDSLGRLLVADGAHHAVDIFAPSGEFLEAITEAGAGRPLGDVSAVAVDPTSGDILVADPTHEQIDEFSPAGAFVGRIAEVGGAPFGAVQGLAVGSTGDIYVADGARHAVDVFGPVATLPDVTTDAASNLNEADTGLTVNGTVSTAGTTAATALTGCHFQYVTLAAYEATGFSDLSSGGEQPCIPAAGSIPNDGAAHPVSASLSGLTPNVVYSYRLLAANENGTSYGAVARTPQLASVVSESVGDVAATSATLAAQLNPNGNASSYRFEYISQADYQANGGSFAGPHASAAVPVPDASIGAGEEPVSVKQHLAGLSPSSVYRYRVRVTNALGPVTGADRTFTTQTPGTFAMLDGRGWELVSPPDKHGANVNSLYGAQAAADGAAVVYQAIDPTESNPAGNGGSSVTVLSAHAAAGWESHDLAAPHRSATSLGGEYILFSQDLSLAAVQPIGLFEPALSPEATESTPFLRTDFAPGDPSALCTSNCYRPLVTGAPGSADVPPGLHFGEEARCAPPEETGNCGPRFMGASPDMTHIVIEASAPLTSGAPEGFVAGRALGNLFEWSAGRLTPVSVLPDGEPALPTSRLAIGKSSLGDYNRAHAISTDGSRVVWAENGGFAGIEYNASNLPKEHLYLRYNATEPQSAVNAGECTEAAKACTLQLDQVKGGSGEGTVRPQFFTASADDSKIFFDDEQRLTANSGAAPSEPDLYECEVVKAANGELECRLTDLTPEVNGEPAGVTGTVLGASADGSTVYFAASGVLTGPQENAEHERAQPGDCKELSPESAVCNLYREHAGTVTFVASISSARDNYDWGAGFAQFSQLTARVSSNGEWLTFMSSRSLTGYDNHDAVTGLPDQEVYLYHGAGSGTLICASCNPTGARPHGSPGQPYSLVGIEGSHGPWAANIPRWQGNEGAYQTRYLSNSGRLFFDSSDALVPQDTNGTEDVYEYEPPNAGSCATGSATFSSASGGCVDLISSGTSPQESAFFDASESGDDVFFLTAGSLSGRDTDTSYDMYDARVGGGEAESPPQPACEGDACQSPVAAPNDPTPNSLTFSGPGNSPQTPAAAPPGKRTAAKSKTQRLAQALRLCGKRKSRKQRTRCRVSARRRFGTARRSIGHTTSDRRAKS
jgi:sugar lactone lactonase YvrE